MKVKRRERLILVGLIREQKTVQTRRYAYLDNAMAAAMRDLVRLGKAGDVMDLWHDLSGNWIGTLKLNALGKVSAQWVWDAPVPLKRRGRYA